MLQTDEIGILYSTATGVVLRTINPSQNEQSHLDWLDQNKPDGTTLLRLNKVVIGADDKNCPNLDTIIPHVLKNKAVKLTFGQNCAIIDENNVVVDVVLACPVLYQAKLDSDTASLNQAKPKNVLTPTVSRTVFVGSADVGDTFDVSNNVIISATLTAATLDKSNPVDQVGTL